MEVISGVISMLEQMVSCKMTQKKADVQIFAASIAIAYFLFSVFTPYLVSIKKNINYDNRKILSSIFNKIATKNNKVEINTATYISQNQILARQVDNNKIQNYINDAKGSVLKLNNGDNTNVESYSYDAYGNTISVVASLLQESRFAVRKSILNSFMYNGERFDVNTGLQYLSARFYNPIIKRFISEDDYNLLNRFNYVNANPIMEIDPTGHVSFYGWICGIFSRCRATVSQETSATQASVIVRPRQMAEPGYLSGYPNENLFSEPFFAVADGSIKLSYIINNSEILSSGKLGTTYRYGGSGDLSGKVIKVQKESLSDNDRIISDPNRAIRKLHEASKAVNGGCLSRQARSYQVLRFIDDRRDNQSEIEVLVGDYIINEQRPTEMFSSRYELHRALNMAGLAMYNAKSDNLVVNEYGNIEPTDGDFIFDLPSYVSSRYALNSFRSPSPGSRKVFAFLLGNAPQCQQFEECIGYINPLMSSNLPGTMAMQ